jgi:hypothetical protein
MRQVRPMKAKKLIALSWWTFGYVIVAGALFAFAAMGDCPEGPEGSLCRARSNQITDVLLVTELFAYLALTWLLFCRRR